MNASNSVDRVSEPRSGQTKDYKNGICYSPLGTHRLGERTVWFARNQDNIVTCFRVRRHDYLQTVVQRASTLKIQLIVGPKNENRKMYVRINSHAAVVKLHSKQ